MIYYNILIIDKIRRSGSNEFNELDCFENDVFLKETICSYKYKAHMLVYMLDMPSSYTYMFVKYFSYENVAYLFQIPNVF